MKDPIFEIIDGDKRKVKRITLPNPVQTTLNLLGQDIPVQLNNYSYTGLGLFVPREHLKNGQISTVESKIVFPKHEFNGQVMYSEKFSAEMMHVGFQLPPDPNSRYLFRTEDPNWDVVKEPSTVKNIYDDLVYKSYECPMQIYQNQNLLSFFPLKQTSSGTIVGEVYEQRQGRVSLGTCYCNFNLFQTYHMFQSEVLKMEGGKIEIKMSPTINRLLRRETLRVEKQEREHELVIRLTSNLLQQEFIHADVFDYSEHGLSLVDTEENFSFPKGMPIEKIQIQIDGVGVIEGKGYVRNYIWNQERKAYLLGLRFDTAHEPNITNWHNFILKARYPLLDFDYKSPDHQPIWDLFDRSGYLHLEDIDKDGIINVTKDTWGQLQKIGTKFSKRAMIKKDDLILGHIQFDQFYPDTWCVHHLALDPTLSKVVGQIIYALVTDILKAEGGEYLINFTELNKPWNQRSYYDFINGYEFKDHNELKEFDIYEAGTSVESEKRSDLFVREANAYDRRKIAKYFELNVSDLERNACNLNQDDINLDNFNKHYEQYGMTRTRSFIVASDKSGEIQGFARVEMGTAGVNIVGVENMLYIYMMKESSDLFHDLITGALKLYRQNGIKNVLLALENSTKEVLNQLNISFVCVANRWIAKKDILPKYYAFSQNLYGHLIMKKEAIKKRNREKNETV